MIKERRRGNVKFFDVAKGWGFIISPEGEDVFVHYRSILSDDDFRLLREGELVTYLQVQSDKGWQAQEVMRENT